MSQMYVRPSVKLVDYHKTEENADFQSIFAHSALTVIPSKRSINDNRKLTTRIAMSRR